MTANKFKVAGTAAAVVIVGMAALAIGQHGGFGPAATGSPAPAAIDGADASGANARRNVRKDAEKPVWRSLTSAQQLALQPLREEWDQMDGVRKQKWLQLANRFGAMKPAEQQRVHERMRAWVKLTPEQRELARETYMRTRKITPDQKNATWESYQQLPEEQKRKLAASAGRKSATASASSSAGSLPKTVVACPAGMVKNTQSATPPCVSPPPPVAPPAPPVQPVVPPAPPPPPVQQEKPVPANWGITPNNA